jgi:predicted Zn finger-like uncharacterized protein
VNVSCLGCRSVYRVDPAKVPACGVRARCSVCSGVIGINVGRPTPAPAQQAPRLSVSLPSPPPVPSLAVTQVVPTLGLPKAELAASPPSPRAVTISSGPGPQSDVPRAGAPRTNPSPTPPRLGHTMPVPPSAKQQPGAAPAAVVAASAATPSSAVTLPKSATAAPVGARRPINPFLSADPDQRAKRLARALVSDIIVYHPDRHAEGRRTGTLRELFREEIKKSYEEYADQVGKEFADRTPHFRDALNEVLGGGTKLF